MTENKDHIQWIKSLDCAHCGRVGPSEPHHIKSQFNISGVGQKAPDWATMPLCNKCHRAFHDADRRVWNSRADRLEAQRYWLLMTMIKAFQDGVFVYGEVPDMTW